MELTDRVDPQKFGSKIRPIFPTQFFFSPNIQVESKSSQTKKFFGFDPLPSPKGYRDNSDPILTRTFGFKKRLDQPNFFVPTSSPLMIITFNKPKPFAITLAYLIDWNAMEPYWFEGQQCSIQFTKISSKSR